MANFAKLSGNKVLEVIRIEDSCCLDADGVENEQVGIEYLTRLTSWPHWKKTSYNTRRNVHFTIADDGTQSESADQTKAFRKNAAGPNCTYNEDLDAFIVKSPQPSWVLNETTGVYEAPVTRPTEAQSRYTLSGVEHAYRVNWDETNAKWTGTRLAADPVTTWDWNTGTSSWDAQ